MTATFRLDMLPGREGDCLILTYGDETRLRRVMVDTGRKSTYRAIKETLGALPAGERDFELLVVSHVDRDHIEGVVEMLSDPALPIRFRDVWFNGYQHLHDGGIESFGPVQGERLSEILLGPGGKWNARFRGRSVELKRLRKPVTLAGGLRLRLLSPDRDAMQALIPEWERECKKAGLVPGTASSADGTPAGFESFGGGAIDVEALAAVAFTPDPSKPNATSIAVLAGFADRQVLLAADGGAERLAKSLASLATNEPSGRVPLAAFKLPHHGSKFNLSPELLALVDCHRFLISSNGTFFNHPQPETIARILKAAPDSELVFNYRSTESLIWNDEGLMRNWHYTATYPSEARDGTISVNLLE
jgi:beta-lactamase superfamily II metal-dependent hydrolase